jgi:predicted metal-dependent hydrolase
MSASVARGRSRSAVLAVPLRRIALAGEPVDYRLVRARRRTIGMHVAADGLVVRASRWVTIGDVEATLREHAAWILRRLAEWRAQRRDVLPDVWTSGAPILFQGRDLTLDLRASPQTSIAADLVNVTVLHPNPDDEQEVAASVGRWLRAEALAFAEPRVAASAARLGAGTPTVRLSNARSEWGSCNRKGEIRLSWRLIQLPPELAQYVVAHEVAHLIELNHSPRFWALVEALHPAYAKARRALAEWSSVLD